ncbi:hypothetical protein RhiirA5_433357 [Rhizophagus irregularis]|uniref:Uncharacterized protein n=1 Tax=Rhizophagus irregularis TaxID=588596 RepID=A0A2I1FHY8_9GLOM|nr:hypothetical protein RhiirA5_433357 [Rhizophagus irregularis]PKC65977.1 hypothetical protein RhiirA1_460343 [Rhizophagus irregularis]PKY33992.1 hypothetical protein RhiirB3_453347 [Rhizophagus irregularis]CAB5346047.1 unnamed protein product [Rhizophagus irregularis]
MSDIKLSCLVQGDGYGDIFEVEIKDNIAVKYLKELIKRKKLNVDFNKLYKVNAEIDEVNQLSAYANTGDYRFEELETEKKVNEYFPKELSENSIHIFVHKELINVAFFGYTEDGKSSIANMLYQGDIMRKNAFSVNDDVKTKTVEMNNIFKVYDMIGLGESIKGKIPHKEAVKEVRNYFSACKELLNYVCYVKKKGRFSDGDIERFKTFKNIFKDAEENIIIIITHCKPEWVERNLKTIMENFGNYPIIAVDFPYDENDNKNHQEKRKQSLQHLFDKLELLNYKGIKLEILSSNQKTESVVAQIIDVVPIAGLAYQLISSGIYYKLGKPKVAKNDLYLELLGL